MTSPDGGSTFGMGVGGPNGPSLNSNKGNKGSGSSKGSKGGPNSDHSGPGKGSSTSGPHQQTHGSSSNATHSHVKNSAGELHPRADNSHHSSTMPSGGGNHALSSKVTGGHAQGFTGMSENSITPGPHSETYNTNYNPSPQYTQASQGLYGPEVPWNANPSQFESQPFSITSWSKPSLWSRLMGNTPTESTRTSSGPDPLGR